MINYSGANANSTEMVKELTSCGPLDKKVIQWMLTLHQIGCLLFSISNACLSLICCFLLLVMTTFLVFLFLPGLDVIRTDRTLVFYEKQEHLSKLWDILSVYAWIDTDVGYCQGE